jgi:hypothetical protein
MALGDKEFSEKRAPISFPRWNEVLKQESLSEIEREAYRQGIISFLAYCKRERSPASVILIQQYLGALDGQAASDSRVALRWFYKTALRMAEVSGGEVRAERLELRAGGSSAGETGPGGLGSGGNSGQRLTRAGDDLLLAKSREVRTADSRDGKVRAEGLEPRAGGAERSKSQETLARADLGGADWERDLIRALRVKGMLWRTEVTYREWAKRFVAFLAPDSPYKAEGAQVAGF